MSSSFSVYVGPYLLVDEKILDFIDEYGDFWANQFVEGIPDGKVIILPNNKDMLGRAYTFGESDECRLTNLNWHMYDEFSSFLDRSRSLVNCMDRENISHGFYCGVVPYWM